MKYQLRFGGEGGQGVITAGEILAGSSVWSAYVSR